MAIAIDYDVLEREHGPGRLTTLIVKFTFDSTYPANGEVVDLDLLGVNEVLNEAVGLTNGGYVAQYLKATNKVKLWYGDNNNAADGPLIENATTDVSAQSVTLTLLCR